MNLRKCYKEIKTRKWDFEKSEKKRWKQLHKSYKKRISWRRKTSSMHVI